MVVGKNTASQNLARAVSSPKLPPLPKLRVRKPNQADANPCIGVMSSVLGCWASQGYSAQGCAMLEQSLRACMDARKPSETKKSNINYHLSRFYPQIIGPHKRK
ncbi:40S ribosomal protein mrp10 [Teratosphaeriaceae sp. CCFEE 6253]|nr:40S ribosomal protein mrp10 [Teratosphaeriaceae sp. CCFEE 6253]